MALQARRCMLLSSYIAMLLTCPSAQAFQVSCLGQLSNLPTCCFFGESRCRQLRKPETLSPRHCTMTFSDSIHPESNVLFSLALAGMLSWTPALVEAAPTPDLSHSPLAKSKVNVVLEGHPRIVDGDTLVFEEGSGRKERVRLLGIDAPESKQMCTNKDGKDYACGVESKAYLESIIGNDPVQCLAAKRDQYSRVLGVCFDEKTGKELNEAMVVNGEAVAYVQFSKAYVEDEMQAMNGHKGVWQGQFQKPWEYRKMKRGKVPKSAVKVSNYAVGDNKKVKEAKSVFELPEEFLDVDDTE